MNVAILASIWCQNLWDELILKNEIKLFESEFSPIKKYCKKWKKNNYRVFSYDYKNPFLNWENIMYKEYFPIWTKKIKNIPRNIFNFFSFINTISWADIVVIWWWWIIYDSEKQTVRDPLDQSIFRTNIINFFRKKLIFYGVWISIKNQNNNYKLKKIFSKNSEIYVRDSLSNIYLKNLWINSSLVVDPVFYDNSNFEKEINKIKLKHCIKKLKSNNFTLVDFKNIDFKDKKIWIAFRSGYFNNQNNQRVAINMDILKVKELIYHIEDNGWEVILLPHSFHKTDALANDFDFLSKCMSDKTKISNSLEETYNYYSQKKLDLCLAERYHSIILSEVYWINYIWFSYSNKTSELLK